MKANTRPRGKPIYVWATSVERTEIQRRAKATALSQSAYLRTVGLGFEPKSIYDSEAVMALAKVNADQGRLGGLLKMWLSHRKGEGAPATDVFRLLNEIRDVQRDLAKAVDLVRPE
jgi:hypothetical protein